MNNKKLKRLKLIIVAWCCWRVSFTMKHDGFQVGFSFMIHSFNGNNHWIKLASICQLVITHALGRLCQWWSNMMTMDKWYLWTLVSKVASMGSVVLCPNSNIQATCIGVWISMVKGMSNLQSSFCQKKTYAQPTYGHSSCHCCATSEFPSSFCFHNIKWISNLNDHLLKPQFQKPMHWTTFSYVFHYYFLW